MTSIQYWSSSSWSICIADLNSPPNNDVICGADEVNIPSPEVGDFLKLKKMLTGSLKSNYNKASNVAVSTSHYKNLNEVFNSPYYGSSSSSIAVNSFGSKSLQVIMAEISSSIVDSTRLQNPSLVLYTRPTPCYGSCPEAVIDRRQVEKSPPRSLFFS